MLRKLLKIVIAMQFLLYGYTSFSVNYYVKRELVIPHDSLSVCNQFACEYDIMHFWVEENYEGALDNTYKGIRRFDTTYTWEIAGTIINGDTLQYLIPNKNEIYLNVGEFGADCYLGGIFGLVGIVAPLNDNYTFNAAEFIVLQCTPKSNFFQNALNNTVCQNRCVSYTDSSMYRPVYWQWQISDDKNEIVYKDTVRNMSFCYRDTGVYTIKQIVWNAKGMDSSVQTIRVISSPNVVRDTIQTINLNNTVEVELQSCATGEQYEWFPKDKLSCVNCDLTTASISADENYYCVVSNENGCAETCYYNLQLPFDVFIPTAFSPNNDGINDVFIVRGRNVEVQSCIIYNRFGNEIYNGRLENGWNGYFNGQLAETGVYAYSISYLNLKTGFIEIKHGNLTLIR
jgi:gliding motility-associated-like protein